jgi:hypothetical protein
MLLCGAFALSSGWPTASVAAAEPGTDPFLDLGLPGVGGSGADDISHGLTDSVMMETNPYLELAELEIGRDNAYYHNAVLCPSQFNFCISVGGTPRAIRDFGYTAGGAINGFRVFVCNNSLLNRNMRVQWFEGTDIEFQTKPLRIIEPLEFGDGIANVEAVPPDIQVVNVGQPVTPGQEIISPAVGRELMTRVLLDDIDDGDDEYEFITDPVNLSGFQLSNADAYTTDSDLLPPNGLTPILVEVDFTIPGIGGMRINPFHPELGAEAILYSSLVPDVAPPGPGLFDQVRFSLPAGKFGVDFAFPGATGNPCAGSPGQVGVVMGQGGAGNEDGIWLIGLTEGCTPSLGTGAPASISGSNEGPYRFNPSCQLFRPNAGVKMTMSAERPSSEIGSGDNTIDASDLISGVGATLIRRSGHIGDSDLPTLQTEESGAPLATSGPVAQGGPIGNVMGDFDGDNDVDLVDFGNFQVCFSGTDMPYAPGCESQDFDCDGDVDLPDFGSFQLCFSGTGTPADLSCYFTGKCCMDATCSDVTESACMMMSGTYHGDCTDCTDPCVDLSGACCVGETCTVEADAATCTGMGGTFSGEGTDCSDPDECMVEPVGGCCIEICAPLCSQVCLPNLTPTECATATGTFLGEGAACSDGVCDLGRCCLANETCEELPESLCMDDPMFASFAPGSDCSDPTPCFVLGACCLPDESCLTDVQQSTCTDMGGVWQLEGSTCDDDPCVIRGGCCLFGSGDPIGDCMDLTEEQCVIEMGGLYLGDVPGATALALATDAVTTQCEGENPCVKAESARDVDIYRINLPTISPGTTRVLSVLCESKNNSRLGGFLDPRIQLYHENAMGEIVRLSRSDNYLRRGPDSLLVWEFDNSFTNDPVWVAVLSSDMPNIELFDPEDVSTIHKIPEIDDDPLNFLTEEQTPLTGPYLLTIGLVNPTSLQTGGGLTNFREPNDTIAQADAIGAISGNNRTDLGDGAFGRWGQDFDLHKVTTTSAIDSLRIFTTPTFFDQMLADVAVAVYDANGEFLACADQARQINPQPPGDQSLPALCVNVVGGNDYYVGWTLTGRPVGNDPNEENLVLIAFPSPIGLGGTNLRDLPVTRPGTIRKPTDSLGFFRGSDFWDWDILKSTATCLQSAPPGTNDDEETNVNGNDSYLLATELATSEGPQPTFGIQTLGNMNVIVRRLGDGPFGGWQGDVDFYRLSNVVPGDVISANTSDVDGPDSDFSVGIYLTLYDGSGGILSDQTQTLRKGSGVASGLPTLDRFAASSLGKVPMPQPGVCTPPPVGADCDNNCIADADEIAADPPLDADGDGDLDLCDTVYVAVTIDNRNQSLLENVPYDPRVPGSTLTQRFGTGVGPHNYELGVGRRVPTGDAGIGQRLFAVGRERVTTITPQGGIVVTTPDRNIFEIDPATGQSLMRFGALTTGDGTSFMQVSGNQEAVIAYDGTHVYLLKGMGVSHQLFRASPGPIDDPREMNPASRGTVVTSAVANGDRVSGMAVIGDLLYVCNKTKNTIVVLNKTVGGIGAMLNPVDTISLMTTTDGMVQIGDGVSTNNNGDVATDGMFLYVEAMINGASGIAVLDQTGNLVDQLPNPVTNAELQPGPKLGGLAYLPVDTQFGMQDVLFASDLNGFIVEAISPSDGSSLGGFIGNERFHYVKMTAGLDASFAPAFQSPESYACCLGNGNCTTVTDISSCSESGGTFMGGASACSEQECVVACCLPDGSCSEETVNGCLSLDGSPATTSGTGMYDMQASCADLGCGPVDSASASSVEDDTRK